MERRTLEAVIYEREPPIARIILNRADKANTKDATLVQEVDACLHEADRDRDIKVVIIKANGKGFCGGHVARWGPDENPYPDFGDTFEDLYKGTADLFLWPTLYLWEFPKPTISQIHGYCMGGGIYLGLLTDFCVASEDAYFQMPLAQSLGEPGGHTMIEPWLLMNWHRTMDWLLLAPTLSAAEALEWGLLNKVVPRDDLENTVEEMARKIAQIPLTTSMAVKNSVKRAYELMGMRVHLQVSHILTNMVGAASDVQERRAQLMQSGLKPRDFVDRDEARRPPRRNVTAAVTLEAERAAGVTLGARGFSGSSRRPACAQPRAERRRNRTPLSWRCSRRRPDRFGPSPSRWCCRWRTGRRSPDPSRRAPVRTRW